ncbi:hypothetical protein [Actinoplanes siamensis]|uniref:Uncharacterized protein n=1 Tax=Actinoplanes siamensis TaxID=1223317 RepID=A0A919TJD7_9ACTN|nr:hypothetical protein [Actinoplanes siamensis]GIF05061.1 hypothetical protein Asi03nite_25990 [Actinoplanes siamensis]
MPDGPKNVVDVAREPAVVEPVASAGSEVCRVRRGGRQPILVNPEQALYEVQSDETLVAPTTVAQEAPALLEEQSVDEVADEVAGS